MTHTKAGSDKKLKENLISSIVYQILLIIIPLITTPYISRTLGTEMLGIYSYNHSIAAIFVTFAMLGVANYGNRSISVAKSNPDTLNITFSTIYYLQLLINGLIIIFYFVYVIIIAKNQKAALVEGLFVLSVLFDVSWLFNGLEEFKLITIRSAIIKILFAIAVFAFVNNKQDIYVYILICSAAQLVSNIFLLQFCKKKNLRLVKCDLKSIFVNLKPMMLLFIPILGINLYKYLDKIMLERMANLNEVGLFESAERLIVLPICFVNALGNVMLPRMSNLYSKGGTEKETNGLFMKSLIFAVAVSSSMAFGVIAVSKEFVPLFFGVGFEKCKILIPILMISTLFLAVANVVRTQYLIPKSRDKEYIISIISGAVANVLLNIILIPRMLSIGSAIATVGAEATVCIVQVFYCWKEIKFGQQLMKTIPYFIISLIMGTIVLSFKFEISIIALLTIKIISGVIIFIGLTFTWMKIRGVKI